MRKKKMNETTPNTFSLVRDQPTKTAIHRVACALLNVSVSTRQSSVAPPDRQTRGGNRR